MKKQAWIQDPRTANTARFHLDPKSWYADPMYFVDSGRPLPDAPPLLKTRSHLLLKQARELWRRFVRIVAKTALVGMLRNSGREIRSRRVIKLWCATGV
jgi:hypothetical protein